MPFHRTPKGVQVISFIGNHYKDKLTYAAEEFLALGVKLEKLSFSYILHVHYQIISTSGLGKNVVKVIQK